MTREFFLTVSALRRLNAFPWASDHQLSQLLPHIAVQRVKRRTVLFPEGAASEAVYVLLSGAVKLSLCNASGEDVLVSLIRPGELFGITALMPEARRAFRCEAFSDCWVGVTRAEVLVSHLLGVSLADFRGMMGSSVGRWFTLLYRYIRFQGLGLRQRLVLALLELTQKFGVQDSRGAILTLRLTHEDLANLVGASRQRVTEHIRELEAQGLILREGRRLIVVPHRLRDLLSEDLVREECSATETSEHLQVPRATRR